jgi:hypothetical protein
VLVSRHISISFKTIRHKLLLQSLLCFFTVATFTVLTLGAVYIDADDVAGSWRVFSFSYPLVHVMYLPYGHMLLENCYYFSSVKCIFLDPVIAQPSRR